MLPEQGRPGPVFIEFCLDIQAQDYLGLEKTPQFLDHTEINHQISDAELDALKDLLMNSERPLILIGGGVGKPRI
jgi:thiamine pyrophosphate-dependent acetolactate synthase large subunit-like protein